MNDTTNKKTQPNVSTENTSKKRYLVASKRGSLAALSGTAPLSSFELKTHLQRFPGVKIQKTINTNQGFSPQSTTNNEAQETHIIEVSDEDLEVLKNNSPDNIIIEEEQFLDFLDRKFIPSELPTRSLAFQAIEKTNTYQFVILGEQNKPLPDVSIVLQSSYSKGNATSNKRGEGSISLSTLNSDNLVIDSVFVKAKTSYWDFYLTNPELSTKEPNIIRLKSLPETFSNFPQNFPRGWGEQIMGLDSSDSALTGKGVKIAIIDTGAGTHPLLSHIKQGYDLSSGTSNLDTWTNDQEGHGTHVAGVITANGDNGEMRGFCPEADILVIKVFPGGTTSALIEAIDICIREQVDVVNMSLGTQSISLAIEQKIEEAVLSGIAMIVAAGNNGGAVQFPANSRNTLAVSAIGNIAEVQENTWDASQIRPEFTLSNAIFSPTFSSFGPEVDVTAPGVAIISTGPDGTFFPDSGTSMAAPHVTGLAGLLLAHHPLFATSYAQKNHYRVSALYQLLRNIAIPYNFGDGRTGYGMPAIYPVEQQLSPDLKQQLAQNR